MSNADAWNMSGSGDQILPVLTWEELCNGLPELPGAEIIQKWDIPLDIARMIFERAMEDTPAPVHLALVSRQVQHWVEPFIYNHLVFASSTQFNLFYRTFRQRRHSPSKSTAFFEKHVKTLHILFNALPRMERVVSIGSALKSLKAAAGWDNSWGRYFLGFLAVDGTGWPGIRVVGSTKRSLFYTREERARWRDESERRRRAGLEDRLLDGWVSAGAEEEEETGRPERALVRGSEIQEDTFRYKDLRRLSISSRALWMSRINLTHRLFRCITHLDIYYHRSFDWSTLTTLKSLTHITVDLLTHVEPYFAGDWEMRACMEELTGFCQALPLLRVIIFACVNWWTRNFDINDDKNELLPPLNCSTEDWDISGPLIATNCDEYRLHYFTQLCLGMHDPRVVIGVVTDCLPEGQLLESYLLDFAWPKNSYDWEFDRPKEEHRESWDVAEEIIERRKKDRMERRRKAGKLPVYNGDESERVEGEFGFGEIVQRRWEEAHSV